MAKITFRKANPSDIDTIRTLADSIWWRHYPAMISEGQICYMLDMIYSPSNLAAQMAQGQHYTLIYDGEVAVGYYAVTERSDGHFFLNKFYIDTDRHRAGIGTQAFQHIKEHDCKGFKEIILQVNIRNVKAINFYFKQGFVIDYAKDFDIGEGYSMDDFMMKLTSS